MQESGPTCPVVHYDLISGSSRKTPPFVHLGDLRENPVIDVMRIVSFDPGLRNLAVCVLEGTSRQDVRIVDWTIIDVLAERAGLGAPRCHKCPAAASWEHASGGEFACGKHRPKTKKVTKKALSDKTITELDAEMTRNGFPSVAKKADKVKLLYNHYTQNRWKKSVGSAISGSVLDLAPCIAKSLDARLATWGKIDHVCVENQMDRRMFGVQAMIQMYFAARGIKCAGVSATHKLSNVVMLTDSTTTYKGRKATGIAHARVLVPEVNQEHFAKHPKKDDLADSFLQGLWVLEHP
jgi:hypothetical protein